MQVGLGRTVVQSATRTETGLLREVTFMACLPVLFAADISDNLWMGPHDRPSLLMRYMLSASTALSRDSPFIKIFAGPPIFHIKP